MIDKKKKDTNLTKHYITKDRGTLTSTESSRDLKYSGGVTNHN